MGIRRDVRAHHVDRYNAKIAGWVHHMIVATAWVCRVVMTAAWVRYVVMYTYLLLTLRRILGVDPLLEM